VVDTGHIVTSAGVSAGIDMALHVVARLHGQETAAWTARRMEYGMVQDIDDRMIYATNAGCASPIRRQGARRHTLPPTHP
jgi:transcriptional regulator GlxA family with amidase domain